MKLRLCGTEIRLSLALLPFLFAGIVTGETEALACAAVSLLLHECAHGIAARNLGFRITALSIYPFGAVMGLEAANAGAGGEWIVAIAGPLGSFLAASVTRLCMTFFSRQPDWLLLFSEMNLAIAVLNLLPVYPLDGGRIAKQLLLRAVRERTANRLLIGFSGTIAAGMTACGVRLALRGVPAWSLLALPAFVVSAAVRECRESTLGPVRRALDRQTSLHAGQSLRAAIVAVHPTMTIAQALQTIRPTRYTILHVTDGVRAADLEESALLAIAANTDRQMPLQSILVFDQREKACYTKLFENHPRIGETR